MTIPQLSEKLRQEVRHVELELWEVTDEEHFWWIMDWIKLDNSPAYHNRNSLLNSFTEGTLYTIGAFDPMSEKLRSVCNPPGVEECSTSLLPVMCVYEKGDIQMLWVASPFRRLGLGVGILNKLMLRYDDFNIVTSEQTEESRDFWKSVDIPEASNINGGGWARSA